MRSPVLWQLFGAVAGLALGVAFIAGTTHGWSAESADRRRAHEEFLFYTLYDLDGPPDEVRAVERDWAVYLNAIGAIVGAGLGWAVASHLIRRRSRPAA
jgi:drug/metabolite transporter (DMT)-like permease